MIYFEYPINTAYKVIFFFHILLKSRQDKHKVLVLFVFSMKFWYSQNRWFCDRAFVKSSRNRFRCFLRYAFTKGFI